MNDHAKEVETELSYLELDKSNLNYLIQQRRNDILEAKIDIGKYQTMLNDNQNKQEHLKKLLHHLSAKNAHSLVV